MARRKVKKRIRKRARRIATFGLISIIAIVLIVITFGSIFSEIIDKYKEKKNLEDKLVTLQETKKELDNDVKKLEDPDYLARYAREKYFYSKNGELILRIPEDKE